ncbi:MAG: MBL fold metallo-hydrolase [Actinobacteria bacterium]|nr:MBL fold metallo-hydrolase [Actinomycetota bacterium]
MEITRLVTAGNRDPRGPRDFENNVWLIGDDAEVVVIDPAHDPDAITQAVGNRQVVAVLLTHGHWDHVRAAPEFTASAGVTPWLSGEDDFLWRESNGDARYLPLEDGAEFTIAGESLVAVHTPGHTPGSTSYWLPSKRAVFTGDTLFQGGPGATRWGYSNFDQIIASITTRLFPLGDDVVVNTGHGPSTTIGDERPDLRHWVDRGW